MNPDPFSLELIADQLEELKQEQRVLLEAPIHIHYTHCLRCGRALGNPKSQKLGFGPVCAKKAAQEAERTAKPTTAKADSELQAPVHMTIDIQPGRDGQWFVVAHTDAGRAHDPFATQTEALDFALAFYGGTVVTMAAAA